MDWVFWTSEDGDGAAAESLLAILEKKVPMDRVGFRVWLEGPWSFERPSAGEELEGG